jgi:hypothetical protein
MLSLIILLNGLYKNVVSPKKRQEEDTTFKAFATFVLKGEGLNKTAQKLCVISSDSWCLNFKQRQ